MQRLIEETSLTSNPLVIILTAIVSMIFLLLLTWFLIFLDKYLRVKIFILCAHWQRVDNFAPGRSYSYSGVYIWQEKGWLLWHTVYVGQSVNVRRRFYQHISGKGSPDIYRQYKKHPQKLRFKSIEAYRVHYKNLDALEKRLIDKYNTYRKGYNKTAGNGHRHY